MGPCEDPSTRVENQAKKRSLHRKWRARWPRLRFCLLKGCWRLFRPSHHPLQRYCSKACSDQAKKWRAWKYRHSDKGKKVRRTQSKDYRKRQKERKTQKVKKPDDVIGGARVTERKKNSHSCDRPGCYEEFDPDWRSPLQRFCSHACRRALERVLERERRWWERHPCRR